MLGESSYSYDIDHFRCYMENVARRDIVVYQRYDTPYHPLYTFKFWPQPTGSAEFRTGKAAKKPCPAKFKVWMAVSLTSTLSHLSPV